MNPPLAFAMLPVALSRWRPILIASIHAAAVIIGLRIHRPEQSIKKAALFQAAL
jgi:hypothetical protein